MKVIVLGGGVIGTTTAFELASQGAEVTLLERRPAVASETSYANAGQISPGYSTPWAAPGIPLKALKWMFQQHAPLALRPDGTLDQLRWMLQLLRNCSSARYAVNKQRMMRIAEYSRDVLRQLRTEHRLDYEQRSLGTLQVFRSAAQLAAAQRDIVVLEQCGVAYELLDGAGLLRYEPGLAQAVERLAGGLRLPNDETGDCRRFTEQLAALAQTRGVRIRTGVTVDRLLRTGDRVEGVRCGSEVLQADRYVMAFGSYSRQALREVGLDIPVYPVKGYSLTVPLRDEAFAPRSTVLDETYKIAITRFDRRIRVGGMAELAGFDMRLDPRRRATLEKVAQDLFPGGELSQAEFWTGLRPMTPDGTPIVGATPLHNLFLNTGHGTLGWTMACGSARVLSDLMLGRKPEIDSEGFSMQRYAKGRATRLSPLGAGAVRA